MRYDDMIRTAVALASRDSPDARAAAFRQLVDLSLQRRDCDEARLTYQALMALSRLQKTVPEALRNAMIDKVARSGAGALHLRLFRHSVSHYYDRLLQVAKLDEASWWRLARRAPPHVRVGMLARRDLPGPVRELLTVQGAASSAERLFVPADDLANARGVIADKSRFAPPLPDVAMGKPTASPTIDAGRSQVRELLDRIAAFRGRTLAHVDEQASGKQQHSDGQVVEVATRWTWRCDETGVLVDSPDMPPRLVGHWLTEFESPDGPEQLVRAIERRVPFRDLTVNASPGMAVLGDWRLSGLPQFDRKSGRFTGYWGSAIALDGNAATDTAKSATAGLYGTGASSEALTTMAHEVRTPLNAIIGFAQLIEGEILGEAGSAYKEQAGNILRHAEQLLGAFDDLSDAARIEQGRYRIGHERFEPGASATEIVKRYTGIAAERDVALVPLIAADLPMMTGDSSIFERALSRLLTASIAASSGGEAILVVIQCAPHDILRIAVTRPRATAGMSEAALLDPRGLSIGDDNAPILGVGFGLKLVGSLAGTVGGHFDLGQHLFELHLPLTIEQRDSEAS